MNKLLKWSFLTVFALFVFIIVALITIPLFIDINKYKPLIKEKVTAATGRTFELNGEIALSLFPWAGFKLNNMILGNPEGFESDFFVSLDKFEVRVKLLPLLSKEIELKRFIIKEPRIVLEKNKDGLANWEGVGGSRQKQTKPTDNRTEKKGDPLELPVKSLTVGDFSVKEGSLTFSDRSSGLKKNITNINFQLKEVSFDNPIHFTFSAKADNLPLSLDGKIGPIGRQPLEDTIHFELIAKLIGELDIDVKGNVSALSKGGEYDMTLKVNQFSPRRITDALNIPFPLQTADKNALTSLSLNTTLNGTAKEVHLKNGLFTIDETTISFNTDISDFAGPDIAFHVHLDTIDLNRYLPPDNKNRDESKDEPKAEGSDKEKKKIDYAPLRTPVIKGKIEADTVKIKESQVKDIFVELTGRSGLYKIDPLHLKMFEGTVLLKTALDVSKEIPVTDFNVTLENIQGGVIVRDFLKRDIVEGVLNANISIAAKGESTEQIKKSLSGTGEIRFNDGAIIGIDIPAMVRNIKTSFGLEATAKDRPKTDFTELHIPFTITEGLFHTEATKLLSPLLRVTSSGEADLVKEELDFRVEPKFVSTLQGQGDEKKRTGIMVPVLITGTFDSPAFKPDLKGMLKETLNVDLSNPDEVKELINNPEALEENLDNLKESGKEILKGLPFGR